MTSQTGLDYPAVYGLLDRLDLTPEDWWKTFDDIQHMEVAALNAINASAGADRPT